MDLSISAEQQMLRESAQAFLQDKAPLPAVREVMETETGYDPSVWEQMAALGWQAMAIPEDYGGAGFTFFEVGILVEEMGRLLTPTPFLATVVMAANLVLSAGTDEQKASILGSISAGETIATVASLPAPDAPDVVAAPSDGAFTLSGVRGFVLDGHIADLVLVEAAEGEQRSLFVVDARQDQVIAERLETLDMTRKQATIEFAGAAATRLGSPGSARKHLEVMEDLAATGIAFEQLGGAQECLDMAVGYSKDRYQFGRAIGSFQAIKHKCADMLVLVEGAKSAAYHAGKAAAIGDADLPIAAGIARAHCSAAYFTCAAENIQIHGGIGFTWEHDAHLYLKRAKTDALLLGDPVTWRAKLADRVGL
jgi:alkylation response protein AidB-like acyl-CoA dehydrogenase